ncbi:Transcriptional regulator, IclR family [hydrothermal vent metagenome]|uniref:Transcriptional regulator, IclR family n=1 Tax=hydrothermal vent metagenome TaxID=652676 RepID=A0A3B0RY93_9ZZZZ
MQSLARAFTMLEIVAEFGVKSGTESGGGIGLSHLATHMGLAPSTVHRLLNSMGEMGYVECDPDTGLWSVGLKAFTVGNAYLKKRDFVSQARPFMKRLVAELGETVNMAILDRQNVVFIAQWECDEVMRMAVPVGTRGPLHASAVGKALLSAMNDDDVRAILKEIQFEPLTEKTHITIKSLMAELQQVRKRGYAIDEQEQTLGMRCIAASIYNEYAEGIAAISISGPTVRLTRKDMARAGRAVRNMAAEITRAIGGKETEKRE